MMEEAEAKKSFKISRFNQIDSLLFLKSKKYWGQVEMSGVCTNVCVGVCTHMYVFAINSNFVSLGKTLILRLNICKYSESCLWLFSVKNRTFYEMRRKIHFLLKM